MTKTKDLVILSLIALIICAVFIFDLYVRLGTAVWLIYIIPLALSFLTTMSWVPMATRIVSAAWALPKASSNDRVSSLRCSFIVLSLVMDKSVDKPVDRAQRSR